MDPWLFLDVLGPRQYYGNGMNGQEPNPNIIPVVTPYLAKLIPHITTWLPCPSSLDASTNLHPSTLDASIPLDCTIYARSLRESSASSNPNNCCMKSYFISVQRNEYLPHSQHERITWQEPYSQRKRIYETRIIAHQTMWMMLSCSWDTWRLPTCVIFWESYVLQVKSNTAHNKHYELWCKLGHFQNIQSKGLMTWLMESS